MKKVTDLRGKEVIHCSTEKEADAICKLMDEAGLKWCSGDLYLAKNEWHEYEKETCYIPCTGEFGSINFLKSNGYIIYEASEFLKEKDMTREEKIEELQRQIDELKSEKDFKVGDIIKVLDDGLNDSLHKDSKNTCHKDDLLKIERFSEMSSGDFRVALCEGGYVVYIEKYRDSFRKATPEEIEEYNNIEIPKINGYKGELIENNTLIEYGCAKLDIDWFKDTDNREIKEFTLSSDVVLTKEDVDRIRKLLKRKNLV